jgi:asparagine synthetase B (glutamine-hydrolysing)
MLPAKCGMETKEQFSDGVGYGWIDKLKEVVAAAVTDEKMQHFVSIANTCIQRGILLSFLFSRLFQVMPQRMAHEKPMLSMTTSCHENMMTKS